MRPIVPSEHLVSITSGLHEHYNNYYVYLPHDQRVVSFKCHPMHVHMRVQLMKKGQIPWRTSHDLISESKTYKLKWSILTHA